LIAKRREYTMLDQLKDTGRRLKKELRTYRHILRDDRTPKLAKILLWVAIGYFALPFDLIPDFIPVLGHLDDAIIIPLLIYMALRMIPEEVVIDCRKNSLEIS